MAVWKARNCARLKLNLPVSICSGKSSVIQCCILKTQDISSAGLYVLSDVQLPVGSEVYVRLILPSGRRINTAGLVWRSTPKGMVVKFNEECKAVVAEFGDGANIAFRSCFN